MYPYTSCVAGGNFVEVVEPALSIHGLYVIFFMMITVFSAFFVSAILLTIFMDTYAGVSDDNLTPSQRRKWACLTLVHILWSRTICSPDDVHGNGQKVKLTGSIKAAIKAMDMDGDGQVDKEEFLAAGGSDADWNRLDVDGDGVLTEEELQANEELAPLAFEQLMLQSHQFSEMARQWMPMAHDLLSASINLLCERPQESCSGHYRYEVAALHWQQCAASFSWDPSIAPLHKNVSRNLLNIVDLDSIVGTQPISSAVRDEFVHACEQVTFTTCDAHCCFRANRESVLVRMLVQTGLCKDSYDEQLAFVRSVLGDISNEDAHAHLYNTGVPLLTVDSSDSDDSIKNVLSTALKINAVQCDRPEVLIPQDPLSIGGNGHVQNVLQACNVLQLVHEMYQIDSASQDPITQNVSALISLVHMQIWRLRLLFDGLDINKDGGLQLVEFEKLWCFNIVSTRLAMSTLLQKEAEHMLTTIEIESLEQDLAGMLAALVESP